MKFLRTLFAGTGMMCLLHNPLPAQSPTQTLRGTVVDKISQSPLPGAVVLLLDTAGTNATSADGQGTFKLSRVPVGKQSIRVTLLGYKEVTLQHLSVDAGKELVLTIQMEEDARFMDEVIIEARVEKNKVLNAMSAVSTRTFSVEETQKFAAAVNDPARMATSFAGVIQGMDGNNHISIRGNSPNGLLWRMEGVEIPNPNHFSNVGTSGGGISILSAQLLSNSDFSTGAFAAEYGNALSGVFDLKLRKGNNQKREYTVQLGFLGADVAAEGPLRKNNDGAYLVNYRYSTLNLLGKMGVPIGDANTNFQDVSFHVTLPAGNLGAFALFGFGGLSDQKTNAEKDSLKWKEDDFTRFSILYSGNTGVVGMTNTKLFRNQAYLKTVLAFSGTRNRLLEEKLLYDMSTFSREYEQDYTQDKITLSSVYTRKLSSRTNLRAGFILNRLGYDFRQKDRTENGILTTHIDVKGNTATAQAFFQFNYKLSPKLTGNAGLHYFQLFLNQSASAEPRASLRYELSEQHHFTLGYGLHGQLQPLGVYFATQLNDKGVFARPNKNLGLSKAHHLVLGYDRNLNEFSHVKTEVYAQHLFHVPVSTDKKNTYSLLNAVEGYYTDPLENKGLGRNYGLELTYERFMHRNLYYLLSGSLYDSRYRAADGRWYNTRFNTNYALSITLGKEWTLSEKRNRILGFNVKSIYTGGFRTTPIDVQASALKGETVIHEDRSFENKNPDYYRLDIRFSVKRNYKRLTSTLALDVQNTTNRKNIGGEYYDQKTASIKYWYQTPLIPVLSYRLEF